MSSSEPIGRLAIVLHSHMPYVEGFGEWPFGEEWLWRAVAESYLRVADVIEDQPVTVGITPVLADQFEDLHGEGGDRLIAFYDESREYCFGEDMGAFHQVGRGDLSISLEPQLEDYRSASRRFKGELDRDLVALFDRLGASGVELLGGPATHCIVPLLATDLGADLQLRVGLESHTRRFGPTRGIWLPECAYDEGTDRVLARAGVEYFCVDQSAVHGIGAPENLQPIRTAAGPVAVPIDWQTIELVWNEHGYPAADAYRSSFDRTIHALLPRNNVGDAWSIEAARAQAHAHAAAFLRSVSARLETHADAHGDGGLCVVAIDTELLGHWWYEGPWWLEEVLRHAAGAGIELVTLGDGVARSELVERQIERSSWGQKKTLETWDSPAVAEFPWQQRAAELAFEGALRAHGSSEHDGSLRAARELLALQSSDWAFLETRGTAGEYGAQRFAGHLAAFERAKARWVDRSVASVRQSAASMDEPEHSDRLGGLAPDLTGELLEALAASK